MTRAFLRRFALVRTSPDILARCVAPAAPPDIVSFPLICLQVDEELRQVERDSIKDYISEAENLSTLHGNLKRCDEYLLKLEQVPE